ncbi:MAG TPA: prepilin-type N-terminal cleavage/methylation domain-containing protein [Burkholderiales bacterium]|nr:prepilin-type N-terminal cleavage/methylation domain-containing protein [Burkholderiales bacterium]
MKQRGFTLVEVAVVVTIVAFLLVSLMFTFSAQVDQRNIDETRRRLEQARELVLSFAIVNGRLPCPARWTSSVSNSGGLESFCPAAATSSTSTCVGTETTTVQTHGTCSNFYDGYLPAASIGYTPSDQSGYALDAWGNRIRYAVARTNTNCSGTTIPPSYTPMFTSKSLLQQYGVTCQPDGLLVCKTFSDTGLGPVTGTSCGGVANQVMSQSLLGAIIFSTGKNGTTSGGTGNDESVNVKTNATLTPQINPIFIFHPPTPSTATNGEFDDQFTWITIGELYGKLIAAGVLP